MRYTCTKTDNLFVKRMISVHCTDHSEADQLWRMLATVPDKAFCTADVYVGGAYQYQVIRTAAGDQTTTLAADPPVHTT
jgi:hypothetical protein